MADTTFRAPRPRARVPQLAFYVTRCLGGWLISAVLVMSVNAQSLHEKVDSAMDAARVGPPARAADDAEFLRRAHLALTGMPPASAEARAFLADTSPDKRPRLIAALAGGPQFVRHLAVQLDVMLMERRAEMHTKSAEWRRWLEDSLTAGKSWDALVAEMLTNDGSDEKTRPQARWILERQAEPNLLTRDAGRLFLGHDLACAQCHDHPRVDDYVQRDYHGLAAFFGRTSLFQPDANKPGFVAESAAGEEAWTSVFTKVTGASRPRLPEGAEITEPVIAAGTEWVVVPNPKDKNVRPVPKYSRRARLAEVLPGSADFRRNIANRLWGMVMGRCLVEPPDMMHSANGPAHPAVLELLGAGIAEMKFDVRAFVRELALTKTFAQAFDPAPLNEAQRAQLAARLPALAGEAEQLKAKSDELALAFNDAVEAATKTQVAAQPVIAEWAKLADADGVAAKAADAARAELQKAEDARRTLPALIEKLQAAAQAGSAVLANAPEDKELAAAAKTFQDKVAKAKADAAAVEKDLPGKKSAAETRAKEAETAHKAAVEKEPAAAESKKLIAAALKTLADADAAKRQVRLQAQQAVKRAAELRALLEFSQAVEASAPRDSEEAAMKVSFSPVPLDQALASLAAAGGPRFAQANLAPIPPEQLAWSILQVTGTLEQLRQSATKEWDDKNKLPDAEKADPAKQAARSAGIAELLRTKVRPQEDQFVRLFANSAGQPQNDFFATADQVLYFENAGSVRGWTNPSGDNLAGLLSKMTDAGALAEELYLSVLTRLPTVEEAKDVASLIEARPKEQRNAAISDAVWALLTSTEFRFRH